MSAAFLSEEWFAEVNARLVAAGSSDAAANDQSVVLEFSDAPAGAVHALTLSVGSSGARIVAGDSLLADTIIRLSYDDALALSGGALDSAAALREGRIKVRGEIASLLGLTGFLQSVFGATN